MDFHSFASCVNEDFRLNLDNGHPIAFRLLEVKALDAHRPLKSSIQVRQQPFSLLFSGPSQPVFGQQVFPLEHDRVGRADIFLVPVGEADSGIEYEAVFT
ncbi:MAG: hypothetical protein AAF268_04005 [Cyanobacteria bacterium P01_A01_bin.3]